VRPWWRPLLVPAVAAAIAALFQPVPAFADPAAAPPDTYNLAVPDVGSRPMALGTLVLPGQKAPSPTPISSLAGVATSPVLQQIEKGRNEIATLGDQLIQAEQDRDLARDQQTAAELKFTQASTNLQQARTAAADAAAQSVIEAAGLPPGGLGGVTGIGDLGRLQRGEQTAQAISRQIQLAQINSQLALDERTQSSDRYDDLAAKYGKLDTQLKQKQGVQQRLELAHTDEINAAEESQAGVDSALGAGYLGGPEVGRGADARAINALKFALAQRGDPYVWSEEGPNKYDCSGLMYAAYRSVGYPLTRVSRDQYRQTSDRVVSRYSLVPGDLLFFSSSNSWHGIHHVAMYAGDGMMVEAPRTGLNVRLTPVRWSRLFQATRVFGSIEGVVQGPELGNPDPDPPTTPDNPHPTTPATTKPPTSSSPPTSKPPTSGSPPTSKPPTSSSPSTSKPPTSSSPPASSSPPTSKPPTSKPTTAPPTTTPPTTTPPTTTPPTTNAPTTTAPPPPDNESPSGGNSTSTNGTPSGGGSSSGGGESSSSSSSSKTPSGSSGSAKTSESSAKSSVAAKSSGSSSSGS